jgi:hypothetical protein
MPEPAPPLILCHARSKLTNLTALGKKTKPSALQYFTEHQAGVLLQVSIKATVKNPGRVSNNCRIDALVSD